MYINNERVIRERPELLVLDRVLQISNNFKFEMNHLRITESIRNESFVND